MPRKKIDGELEVDQDLAFERIDWKLQRALLSLVALIVVLAAIGLTGAGGLGDASSRTPNGALTGNYERFLRRERDSYVSVHAAWPTGSDTLSLWIRRHPASAIHVGRISPEPVGEDGDGERIVYRFVRGAHGGEAHLVFALRPVDAGGTRTSIGVEGNADSLTFSQFVYP